MSKAFKLKQRIFLFDIAVTIYENNSIKVSKKIEYIYLIIAYFSGFIVNKTQLLL